MNNHLRKENRLRQEEVDAACAAILQRGERIGTVGVYHEVGQRGSFSTVQRMVKDWEARNPDDSEKAENLPIKVELPDSLKSVADNALKTFWHQARELAESELAIQWDALKKAEDEVNLKIAELQEFSDNQSNTIEVLRDQLAQVTTESTEHKAALETECNTTTQLTEKFNQAAHDLELSNIENKALTERLAEMKALHDKEAGEFDAKIKISEEKVKSLDTQVTKLQAALDIQDKHITETKAERAEALSAEKVALEKAATLTGQLTRVLEENKGLKNDNKALETKVKELP